MLVVADLTEKAALYAEAGILEYWIVDATAHRVHTFAEPRAGAYQSPQRYEPGQTVSPRCSPQASLDVADLFG